MKPLLLCAALTLCVAPFVHAQDDVEGSKDHPMFSRMPGYYIQEYDAQDFGTFEFDLDGNNLKKVDGRYWGITYSLKEGAKKYGPVQIARNYTELMVKRGGRKIKDEVDAGGGESIATMPLANGKTVWFQIFVSNAGENYEMHVVEEAGMEQKVEFTAMELARALADTGSVALHNILFDTGKATIKPESAAALAVVGELLKDDGALKLEIQGHTDNVGQPAANLKLSQDRAAAVKTYLVQTLGVDAVRLTTAGFGDTKPVADNKTDAGRSQNRRVELVKR
jgi:OOP family OmpA-OmpF porin